MRAKLFIASLLICGIINAQTINADNILLGYQGFPTAISSHAADANGNQYYTGTFRGQLEANNQVLTNGNGLEDVFWIKTNASGQVTKYKIFGSAGSNISYPNSMVMGNSTHMLFGLMTQEPMTIGTYNITPYSTANGSSAGAIVYSDTAGNVTWVRKTNLTNFRLYYRNGIFHLLGQISQNAPAVRFENQIVTDSIGRQGLVHLMISESGTFLRAKTITPRKQGQNVSLYNAGFFSDGQLMLHLKVDADSSFYLNNVLTPLPNNFGNYNFLVKTDTSYTNPKARNLNPQRHPMGLFSNGPALCMAGDSVYMAFNYENFTPSYTIDGFQQFAQRNWLYVFDSSLTAKRQVFLASSFAGNYPANSTRRRIHFRSLFVRNGLLYLNGVYTGINESPLNLIPIQDTVINILPNLTATVNQNGPSRSFMAKCLLDGQGGSMAWYGEHTEYENSNVFPMYFHDAGFNRIAFYQSVDNVWNPWIMDHDLAILSGSMKKNADGPEQPQMIQFFDDGSRIVIGFARGKTALDSSGSFISNAGRRDVFIARLKPNNQVAWFKRFHSTLVSPELRGLEIRNGKAWFLVNYIGTQNDSNFIKIGTSAYPVRVNASLLASIDTTGNLNVLNLADPVLRTVFLRHFSFFANGDLLVATDNNYIPYQNFPPGSGSHLFRLNASTGAITDARKLFGSASSLINSVQVDNNNVIYLSTTNFNTSTVTWSLHNGSSIIHSIQLAPNTQPLPSLFKMEWNTMHWLKRFTAGGSIFSGKQFGDLLLVNNKPVLSVTPFTNQPLYWEGQLLNNGFPTSSATLVKLDTNGTVLNHRTYQNMSSSYNRSGANNQIYVSGVSRGNLQADTIQVGYSGGIVDAISLVLDSNLVAKRSYRVGSLYSESMADMDIHQDSIIALAFTSQTAGQVYMNKMTVADGDYEEDGYVGTFISRPNVVTAINEPLPVLHLVTLAPNPIANNSIELKITVPESLRSIASVYGINGQFISSTVLQLVPGTNRYKIALPASTGRGTYHVIINNKRWTTTRRFVIL